MTAPTERTERDPVVRLAEWIKKNQKLLIIVTAVVVAFVLKKTLLSGPTPPFVMELPGYKMPSVKVIGRRLFDSGWDFVRQAGTLIFAVTVLVWAAAYFPRNAEIEREYDDRLEALGATAGNATSTDSVAAAEKASQIENARQGALIRQSSPCRGTGSPAHWG